MGRRGGLGGGRWGGGGFGVLGWFGFGFPFLFLFPFPFPSPSFPSLSLSLPSSLPPPISSFYSAFLRSYSLLISPPPLAKNLFPPSSSPPLRSPLPSPLSPLPLPSLSPPSKFLNKKASIFQPSPENEKVSQLHHHYRSQGLLNGGEGYWGRGGGRDGGREGEEKEE